MGSKDVGATGEEMARSAGMELEKDPRFAGVGFEGFAKSVLLRYIWECRFRARLVRTWDCPQ